MVLFQEGGGGGDFEAISHFFSLAAGGFRDWALT